MTAKIKNSIDKARKQLTGFDAGAHPPDIGELVERLSEAVARIHTVWAGEVRIIVLGVNGSLKSTTLRLLIGDCPAVRSGAGPIIGPLTDIRLVQSEDTDRPAIEYVTTLSESRARARALKLLELPTEDERTLAELTEVAHKNHAYVRDIFWGAQQFGFGRTLTVAEFVDRGGALAYDAAGRGSLFLLRRYLEQPVTREQWDLSWARGRSVVLTDTPGTRHAGPLEDVILGDARLNAHISLLTTSVAAGGSLEPKTPDPNSHRVLVLTRVDQLDAPSNENELASLRDNVMLHKDRLNQTGRSTELAAVSGPWSTNRAEWIRLDPDGGGELWDEAQRKKASWLDGLQTAALVDTELRTAVTAATKDGGALRLQTLIEELAGRDTAAIDREELGRLEAEARELVEKVNALTVDSPNREQVAIDLRDRAAKDARPIQDLKRIAEEIATARIYDHDVWPTIRGRFRRFDDQWRAPVADVYTDLTEMDLIGLANEAIEDARTEIDSALEQWRTDLVQPGIEVPQCVLRIDPATDERAALVKILVDLADVLTDRLTAARRLPGERNLHFLEIAKAREELTRLLAGMIVHFFEGPVQEARTSLPPGIVQRGATEAATRQLKSLVAAVSLLLNALADWRKTNV
ncbi:hypothetical protein ACTD5D_21205 [Nocardia takedensis]|uniref:hypothetical protein n=1 Tax=Nocardia takedensis TaxID=259390 RepID=UPI003F7709F6